MGSWCDSPTSRINARAGPLGRGGRAGRGSVAKGNTSTAGNPFGRPPHSAVPRRSRLSQAARAADMGMLSYVARSAVAFGREARRGCTGFRWRRVSRFVWSGSRLGDGRRRGPTMTYRAVWNGQVLAESDRTVRLEGNHYFPPQSLRREFQQHPDDLPLEGGGEVLHGHRGRPEESGRGLVLPRPFSRRSTDPWVHRVLERGAGRTGQGQQGGRF
jgi:hypothetical protein